jgi:hypothetical protein
LGHRTPAALTRAMRPPRLAISSSSSADSTTCALATASLGSRRMAMFPAEPRLRRRGRRARETRLPIGFVGGCGGVRGLGREGGDKGRLRGGQAGPLRRPFRQVA